MVDHGQEQSRVGAGLDVDPLVGLGCGGGVTRIDANNLGSRFLGIQETAGPHHASLQNVAIHVQNHVGVFPVPDGIRAKGTYKG